MPQTKPTSEQVTFLQAGTGATQRTALAKLRDTVSVKDFGAVGDGVADDTAAIQAAVDAIGVNGGVVVFPSGGTYKVTSINTTGKLVILWGYGAIISCQSATGAIYKTDHGNKLSVFGLTFNATGTFRAINCQQAPSSTVYYELEISDCTFNMGSGVFGIYCVGTREPHINDCTFTNTTSGCGIYFSQCVSPFVIKCIFKGQTYTGTAVSYPGTGTPFDAGLVLRDCEIMGWNKGVEIIGCDWLVIEGCTIDYNNYSIKLAAQDEASISGNYIGSLADNAALWITDDATVAAPTTCQKIIVINNTFTGHYTGGNTYDCVLIDGATSSDDIQLVHNSISFFTRYGINFRMLNTRLSIISNSFSQRTTFGVAPIYNTLGANDSGVIIKDNHFRNTATISQMNISIAMINENIGCVTEAKGQAIAGSAVTTFNIAHGLSYTPTISDCQISASNAEAALKNVYVSSVDATNLVAGFTTATAVNAGINWRIRRGS